MSELVAIFTGDLIASTAAPDRAETAMQVLARAAATLGHWAGQDACFTRFRGDGWQLRLARPGLALRAALYLTANLTAATALPSRIAIGIGPLAHPGTRDLSDARGAAFEQSGRALDSLPRNRHLALAGAVTDWQIALVTLADWHARRWSAEQAEAAALALAPDAPGQTALAQHLGITRQAIAARLSGAGLAAWEPALHAFESFPFTPGGAP